MDWRSSTVTVHLKDGYSESIRLDEVANILMIHTSIFTPADNTLELRTTRGDTLRILLQSLPGTAPELDRPVVYLDQNHWSTLSRRIHGNGTVAPQDAGPADKIIERARAGEILVPMSAGHAVETSPLYGDKRQNLAATLLSLSSGWQMLNPVDVRMAELATAVATNSAGVIAPRRDYIFSPARPSLFTSSGKQLPRIDPYDPGTVLAWMDYLVTAVTVQADVLLNPEPEARVSSEPWANELAAIAADPGFQAMPRARRRERAHAHVLRDAAKELTACAILFGVGIEEAIERTLAALRSNDEKTPFFGLWADVIDERLSSFHTKWQSNDLIDMMFLGCAAAYGDLVIAERPASNYLNTVWKGRQNRQCPVVPTLREAVDRLDDLHLGGAAESYH